MSSRLPSTITVYVEPLDAATTTRPFGYHPVLSIAGAYISLLLTSSVLSFSGVDMSIVTAVNFLILIVPAMIAVYCYSKPLVILRNNQKWMKVFLSGLRLELGSEARLTNSAEMMIALRSNAPVYADVSLKDRHKTYDVAVSDSEVVLFSMTDIDREWILVNAQRGQRGH